MKRAKRRAAAAGVDVVFVGGGDMRVDGKDARGVLARYSNGKRTIFVRVDDMEADADQLVRHELGHDAIHRGDLDVERSIDNFRKTYHKGAAAADLVIDTYLDIKGFDTVEMTDDERQEALAELVCDALGDINEVSGNVSYKNISAGFDAMRASVMGTLKEGKRAASDTETKAKTLKPVSVRGVAVSRDVAEVMDSADYSAPIDYMDFSVSTLGRWKEEFLKAFNSKDTAHIARVVEKFTDKMIANAAIMNYVPVGSYAYDSHGPIRSNVEYVVTFDMDTSCPRTFQFLNYRNALQAKAGRPLTYNESVNLLELMRAYGQQIPCAYCYVENKRVLLSASYNNFFKFRQNVMNAENDETALKEMYSYNAKKKTVSEAAQKVFEKWRSDTSYNPTGVEVWQASQTARNSVLNYLDAQKQAGAISENSKHKTLRDMVSERFDITDKGALAEIDSFIDDWVYDAMADIAHNYSVPNSETMTVDERALSLNHEALAYAKSASSAKTVENFAPYAGQLKLLAPEVIAKINAMGGVRKHSSNDFRVDYVQDYIMFFADAAEMGLFGHTYTKSTDYVKIFGRTGDRINMSIAMYGDEKSGIRENMDEGMGWKDARELHDAYPNAGVMAMVTNNDQLSLALNSEWIDMIIPFHASGLDKAVWYNLRMWSDYTSKQLERFITAGDMKKALKAKGVVLPSKISAAEVAKIYNEEFNIKIITDADGNRVKPHFLPGEQVINGQTIPGHHNDVATYMKLCEEYGVRPRFYGVKVKDAKGKEIDVTEHPGYIKLVKETARTDSKQEKIKFNFDKKDPYLKMTPLEYAMQRMEEEAKNGGFENTKADPYGIVDEFEREYLDKNRPLGYLTERARETQKTIEEMNRKTRDQLDDRLREETGDGLVIEKSTMSGNRADPAKLQDAENRLRDENGNLGNKKIAVGMTDSERADILREKEIPEIKYDGSADEDSKPPKETINTSRMTENTIVPSDIEDLQKVGKGLVQKGERPSVLRMSHDDLQKAQKWAQQDYADENVREKSPFFRAWFGDWRSSDQTVVKVAEIPEYEDSNEFRKGNRGTYKNNDTKWDIRVSRQGETNTIAHAGSGKLSKYGLSGIQELVENAVLLDSEVHEHHANDPKVDRIAFDHRFYALGRSGNDISLYRITVEEGYQDRTHTNDRVFHNLKHIEKVATVGGRTAGIDLPGVSTVDDIATKYKVADLYEFVKRYDEEFTPAASVSRKLLGKDGTPKTLYHWTNAEFDSFDMTRIGSNQGQTHGDGIYLSTSPTLFSYAGGKRMDLYAAIRNPFEMELTKAQAQKVYNQYFRPFHEDRFHTYEPHVVDALQNSYKVFDYLSEAAEKNGIKVSDILKNLGYDGVHDGPEWVAFDRNQVKSVDNLGTFDSGDSNIYLSTRGGNSDLSRLQNENARLKKRVEYWQGQTKATKGWKADPKQEARETKRILESVSSKADADEMTKRITQLHEDLSNGKYTFDEGKAIATDIASDIIAKSEALVSKDMETYREARRIIKSAPTVRSAYEQLQRLMGEDVFPDFRSDESRKNQIDEVMESLKPFVDNPYDLGKAVVIDAVADDIIDTGMNVSAAKPTPVDVERAKTADAVAAGKRAVEEQRLVDDMFYGRKIAEIRSQRDAKIEKILQHQRDVNAARREMRQERADREKLRKIVQRLQGKKVDPVTKAMLPDIVRELDATAVNITDKSISNLAELRQWYNDKTTEGTDIYDPNFIPDKATLAKLDRLEKAMKGKTIGQMDIVQVRELTEILQNIEHQANESRKFQQSQLKIDNYEAGLRTIQDIENARPGKINRELSPQRAARRIAGYNDGAIEGTEASPLITLMDETVEGERKADIYQRTALHRLSRWTEDKGFMRKLYGRRAERIMITGIDARTGEKRTVAITPAMRVSLYLHSLNNDNMRHIQEGGVVIPGERNYRSGKMAEAYAEDIRIKLTKTNVNRIVSGMSAKERAFADAIWRYFNEYAPQRLNEASVLIDGYEKFNEENYFPISVDKNFLSQDYETVIMDADGSLTHPGFGEERIQSAKPIYLRDVNDVFMTAVRTNAMYACQAVPLMNLAKLVNVQQVGAADSVSAALGRQFTAAKTDPFYSSASDYLAKYMRDYAGNRAAPKSGLGNLLAKMRSNYSGAVLNLGAGTAIKQAASYPTALAVVSPRALASAMNPKRTVDVSFIDEMTAAFTKRTEGLSTVELAEMTQEGKTIPRALNWIQAVDVGTTALLKRAAAIEVQITTDLQIGSPEYKRAVVDMYIKIIEQTQPNYSIALRPEILRSENQVERALVMFATQPMQNFGILYDAVGNLNAKRRAYENSKTKETEAAFKAAKKNATKAFSAIFSSTVVFALMQYLWDAFRKKDDKYRENGEITFQSFAKGLGLNMLSSGAGMLIAGKVGLELFETASDQIAKGLGEDAIFNSYSYGFEVAELAAGLDAIKSLAVLAGAAAKLDKQILTGEDADVEAYVRKAWQAAEDALLLFGIPLENATNLLTAVAQNVCVAAMGKYKGKYYATRITADPESGKSQFYDNLFNCWMNASEATVNDLYETMLDDGFDADSIKSSMESKLKKKEGVSSVKDLSKRWPY